MIAALTGRLAFKAPTHIVMDVQGVGYQVSIPLNTYYSLPELNEHATLHIHTHLREDTIQLYGFLTSEEKGAFLLLTGVSGIGPKLALSVLSALSVPDLIKAVQGGDLEKLTTIPGVGKKSAGRMVLELKDTIERLYGDAVPSSEQVGGKEMGDACSALVNLGYRPSEAKQVLKRLSQSPSPPESLKDLIREALRELSGG